MNTPTAIFGGLAMIAAAIFLTKATPGMSQGEEWQIVDANVGGAWKLNSMTGALFYCSSKPQGCVPIK